MSLPSSVRIVEVGPRDGLQNEPHPLSLESKIELVDRLTDAGLTAIETGSFVNPRWVPQMADSLQVFQGIRRNGATRYSALIPNMTGFERAVEAGANEVAVFAAATETFSQKNTNCSVAESLTRFGPIAAAAAQAKLPLRGYISCVASCPYEGSVDPLRVQQIAVQLLQMGCYEVSLGDTTGVATPATIECLLDTLEPHVPVEQLAMHCHDTYGMAIANIHTALQRGVAVIDSSVAGLGGCPYAPGASGNVATEDVVYLLNGLGIRHGVDLHKLQSTGEFICRTLSRRNNSRAGQALSAQS